MKIYFSVGETAKAVHTTIETLRHYDRIGLVKPSKKDDLTNYRYYTQQDIVRINTVRALQQMKKWRYWSIAGQKYSWQNQIMRINLVDIFKQRVSL